MVNISIRVNVLSMFYMVNIFIRMNVIYAISAIIKRNYYVFEGKVFFGYLWLRLYEIITGKDNKKELSLIRFVKSR